MTSFENLLSIKAGFIYINWSVWAYFLFVHFLIVFLAAYCGWLIITTTIGIYTLSNKNFKTDLSRVSDWLRSDKLGGIRPLSDLSVKLLLFFIVGVMLLSPMPIIYNFSLYAIYLFGILIAGSSIFLFTQFLLRTRIMKEKKRLLDLAETGLSNTKQIDYVLKIDKIKEWPVDLKILSGLFISNIVWPLIIFYLVLLLGQTFKFPI